MQHWSIAQAKALYNIDYWSDGFFDIDAQGYLVAYPTRDRTQKPIRLMELVAKIQQQDLSLPVLVRFNQILHRRVADLQQAFTDAITQFDYQNTYTPVYPIKVNQQRRVVAELLRHQQGEVGLEAGSKPELLAVLGLSAEGKRLIICNGYKDREYIRLALLGRKLGHDVYIIVEKSSEIDLILQEAANLKVAPLIGIRVRLAAMGAGKWQNSGGERAKFGLSAAQVLKIVERLQQNQQLSYLKLLHFHMGSQVSNIRDIQQVLREAASYYATLYQFGARLEYVDVGGGLGVDYEGTRSRSFCSMNYNMQEYANNVVHTLGQICRERKVPFPRIITESGRAMVAHHAVLITNVIDRESHEDASHSFQIHENDPMIVKELWQNLQSLSERSLIEVYHDAVQSIMEVHSLFSHGLIDLMQRAKAERIYVATCLKVRDILQQQTHRVHLPILNELNEKLADKYFCNFSVFQSTPDVWGIDQIFPIMPLSGLEQRPMDRATLHDLTCDSDGQINGYVDGQGVETTLPIPPFNPNNTNLIGIFLVGAYQEILGDMHNLFGDTHSIHVEYDEQGNYALQQPLHGDRVKDVLRYVHVNAEELQASYHAQFERIDLDPALKQAYLEEMCEGLEGYTYLEE